MLEIPLKKLKTYLILLLFLGITHFAFENSKGYSSSSYNVRIKNGSKLEYFSLLENMEADYQSRLINNTKITYFKILPESSIYIFYIGYFIIGALIVSSLERKESEAEVTEK